MPTSAVARIAADPNALPPVGTKYRRVRVRRFPYVLVLRQLTPQTVKVVAVAHTSRRPKYWRRRD